MKHFIKTAIGAAAIALSAGAAQAVSLDDVVATGPEYFNGIVDLDYNLTFGPDAGSITDLVGPFPVGGNLSFDSLTDAFISSSLTVFDTDFSILFDGTVEDHSLSQDFGPGDDVLTLLLVRSFGGATPYAIATLTGDLDALGGFFAVGFAGDVNLTVTGAITPAIPLPASLPLLLAGIGGMGYVARRRKA
ncbi:hypothetical protein OB2597_08634 [Pseudooceanicola batsensis HTCC2597]|uniref:Ice-binding protein C-terminal domain-containing protein n=1 Tax=Pseudooceanicola batsensis (strain ATCC BAA-863 / DSM 15984 / KCTC 12145 / HTCC2597) TaxID=252305 RepID=A3TUJ9_PSEBH|nr:VPLPA-CTERM sorting domain-containing protein [Pseudooceanicola batsensis]EAQ04195.1 hypothetical protein OB2597_08634 [Pseudooceanicola batsensis HTCC2597]